MSSEVEITGSAQHSSWLNRTLPPVEQLRTDLWSIPVPIPNSPLRYTSVYVLGNSDGLLLIDAGWDDDDSWAALCAGLESFGATVQDVRGCLVTHQHFDHLGLARRVREASDAWIGLHPADRDAIAAPEFRVPSLAVKTRISELVGWGASRAEAEAICADQSRYARRSTAAIPDRLIEDNEMIQAPDWSLRAVHTPGHTPGHLCFVDEAKRLLFSGDHVLPRISPHVSVYRTASQDAVADFLRSLQRCATEDIDEVLPAHEWRFRGLQARTAELVRHHERRQSELLDAVGTAPGHTPWELAGQLSWSRPWEQYDGHLRAMAVSETVAHLTHLVNLGRIVQTGTEVPRYAVATGGGPHQRRYDALRDE